MATISYLILQIIARIYPISYMNILLLYLFHLHIYFFKFVFDLFIAVVSSRDMRTMQYGYQSWNVLIICQPNIFWPSNLVNTCSHNLERLNFYQFFLFFYCFGQSSKGLSKNSRNSFLANVSILLPLQAPKKTLRWP